MGNRVRENGVRSQHLTFQAVTSGRVKLRHAGDVVTRVKRGGEQWCLFRVKSGLLGDRANLQRRFVSLHNGKTNLFHSATDFQ